jgi:hypothetical protein
MTIIVDTIISTLDYAELQTQVIDWTHRADLASRIPEFIRIAESELFREFALHNIETSISGTTSGSTITIPVGLSAFERIKIEAHGHEYTLDYTSPNGISALSGSTNTPTRFVIENGVVNLYPAPDGEYSYTIYYIPTLSALSEANTSNWLLENHPDLYLKATLLQVAKFTKNQFDIDRLAQEVGGAVNSIIRSDERKRFPIAGGLQIKPRSYR